MDNTPNQNQNPNPNPNADINGNFDPEPAGAAGPAPAARAVNERVRQAEIDRIMRQMEESMFEEDAWLHGFTVPARENPNQQDYFIIHVPPNDPGVWENFRDGFRDALQADVPTIRDMFDAVIAAFTRVIPWEALGNPRRPLSQTQVNELSSQQLTQEDIDGMGPDNRCGICLEDYKEGETITTLPCGHSFHRNCIRPWLTQQADCPMCRSVIRNMTFQVDTNEVTATDTTADPDPEIPTEDSL